MMIKFLRRLAYLLFALSIGLLILVRWLTFQPRRQQQETILYRKIARKLAPNQRIKVMSYNVQYMAGKNYFFFYDGGPDTRPSTPDIRRTVEGIADLIRREDPDIILLQEVDDGATRTDYEDQLAVLLNLLPDTYTCHTSAFYWKAKFVPHPQIWGKAGMKLSVISKYQINKAIRHQLPLMKANYLYQQFNAKRAVLEVHLPMTDGTELVVLNTHLDAFANPQTMLEQVAHIDRILSRLSAQGQPWIIGGDFNLLPPGQHRLLSSSSQAHFQPHTELKPMYRRYQAIVPDNSDLSETEGRKWFSFSPNDPAYPEPVCSLDHMFYAKQLYAVAGYVRQHDTQNLSDHLPIVATFVRT